MAQEKNVILLYGNDEYAMARRLAEFTLTFADRSQAEMNTARLDAATATEAELNNAVNALPFLARQRLVLLANPSARFARRAPRREADDGKTQAQLAAEARQKFGDFLAKVPPTTKLVMWEYVEARGWGSRTSATREDSQNWLVGWVRKSGTVERFPLPDDKEMTGWIVQHTRDLHAQIATNAAAKLKELVGTDTRQAAQEIDKLLTYVNWGRPITLADVSALTPHTAEASIWNLVDALGAGDGRSAQRLLHEFLADGEAFYVWSMIIRMFRLMLLAREVIDSGGGLPAAQKALGVGEYPAKKALNQARRFQMDRIEAIYHRLLEIDEAAKTGRMPLDLSLDLLVVELTS